MMNVTEEMMKQAQDNWESARCRVNKLAHDNEVDMYFSTTDESDLLYELFDYGNNFDISDDEIVAALNEWF